jgi:2-oxo-4-hydroxy-4-carboxy--5-ureidoimidazoline (OHCU) decarboxylase
MQARTANSLEVEFQACLEQIYKIARFRLDALFQ